MCVCVHKRAERDQFSKTSLRDQADLKDPLLSFHKPRMPEKGSVLSYSSDNGIPIALSLNGTAAFNSSLVLSVLKQLTHLIATVCRCCMVGFSCLVNGTSRQTARI